jgi:hypothetical protein
LNSSEDKNNFRDKPAERGITINNVLLGLLLIGGTLFGNMLTEDITEIKKASKSVETSLNKIQIENGKTYVQIDYIKRSLDEHKKTCKESHSDFENRIKELELFMQTHRAKEI